MSSLTSPFKVLGVHQNATTSEIKTAYRKLAMATHPDMNNGCDEKFKVVTDAYNRLSRGAADQPWDGCSKAGTAGCSMRNGCSSMWNGANGELST